MKQISIVMLRNGVIVSEEIFYIKNSDFFVEDAIEEYVESLREMYVESGMTNIAFRVEIVEIFITDNYDLVKYLKGKIKYNKEQIEKLKNHRKKLDKVMKKWWI